MRSALAIKHTLTYLGGGSIFSAAAGGGRRRRRFGDRWRQRRRLRRPRSISAYKRWVANLGTKHSFDGISVEAVHPIDVVIGQLRTANGVEYGSLVDLARYSAASNMDGDEDEGQDWDGVVNEKQTGSVDGHEDSRRRRSGLPDEQVLLLLRALWPYLQQLREHGLLASPSPYQWEEFLASPLHPVATARAAARAEGTGEAEEVAAGRRIRLTVPAGFLLADDITAEIWARLS
eukprot:COSAG05_NODE_326_length_11360_cov_47.871781_3_plen_233_part_00